MKSKRHKRKLLFVYLMMGIMLVHPIVASASNVWAIPRKANGYIWNSVPLTINFNFEEGTNEQKTAVRSAMNMWNAVEPANSRVDSLITLKLTVIESDNKIKFVDMGYWQYGGYTDFRTIAGSTTIAESVDVWLSLHCNWGREADMQTIAGHELGHVLGVAHCHEIDENTCFSSTCGNNLMQPEFSTYIEIHSLTAYDESSYQIIYY